MSDETDVALPRVRHPARVIGFGVAMLLVLAGAFVAGRFVKAPTDDALEAAKTVVPVVVTVENRVVDDGFALPASLTPGKTFDVTIPEASEEAPAAADEKTKEAATDRILVTATAISPGDTIGYGQLLGEVSGRPVFSLPTSVPLYRDLVPSATGKDITALQRTLTDLGYYGVRTTGTLDAGTLDAVRRLYKKAGYDLPSVASGVQGIAWREFAALPSSGTTVVSVATVGTALSSDTALLRLQTSPAVLTTQVTAVHKDALAVGSPVGVSVNGSAPAKSSVLAVGAFATDADSGASGYPVTVGIPAGLTVAGDSTLQLTPLEKPAAGPAVPVVALRQGADGTSVRLHAAAGPTPAERSVAVEVVVQKNGWASIKPNPKLPPGTKLVVEP